MQSLCDQTFGDISALMYDSIGLSFSPVKKSLVSSRLAPRIQRLGMDGFEDYLHLIASDDDGGEFQMAVDLLTTNETYFFREPGHFHFLRDEILKPRRSSAPFRVWSAACSSGEEVYTLAMLLDDTLTNSPWEVVGSDISTQVLAKAEAGHYPLGRHEGIPPAYLSKYCLKGVRSHSGTFLITPELKRRTRFHQVNLTLPVDTSLGEFEVIFLRNVMIYFDTETKRKVVGNLLPRLKSGGHLIIGHSETLNGIQQGLEPVRATIYRKP